MNIALITYDEDLKNSIKNKLAGNEVKTYIDSISMLKDLNEFSPDVIIYDASAGDFAFDDLKFLISRDKVREKKLKVIYSKINPINKESINGDNIEFYTKEEEVENLINEIYKEAESSKVEETSNFVEEEQTFSTPEDIESFYSNETTSENIPEFESMFSNISPEEIENFGEDTKGYELMANEEEQIVEVPKDENVNLQEKNQEIPQLIENKYPSEEDIRSNKTLLNISIDLEDIKKGIVMVAVDKLVENLKNEPEIKELINTISRDFADRIDGELEKLKKEIRNEFKENTLSKMEEEIMEILKRDLKDYIAQITSEIVKEKLDKIFNK